MIIVEQNQRRIDTFPSGYPDGILRCHQPEIIPPGSWVAIDDVHLVEKMYRSAGMEPPEEIINGVRRNIIEALREVWGTRLEVIPWEKIKEGITGLVKNLSTNHPDFLPVSLDPDYYFDHYCAFLHINRIVSLDGKLLGYESRPGQPPIEKQAEQIRQYASQQGKKGVFLIDDFIAFGGTLGVAINAFNNQHIKVGGIISGISSQKAIASLKQKGFPVSSVYEYSEIIDALCLHDLFAGMPRGGLILGDIGSDGKLYPYRIGNLPLRRPYAAAPPNSSFSSAWASIPPDKAPSFSEICWRETLKLLAPIRRDIRLGDGSDNASGIPVIPHKSMLDTSGNFVPALPDLIADQLNGKLSNRTIYSFPDE